MGGHSHVIVKRSKSMFALFKFGVSFCLTGPRHSTGQFAAVCNRAGITSAFKKTRYNKVLHISRNPSQCVLASKCVCETATSGEIQVLGVVFVSHMNRKKISTNGLEKQMLFTHNLPIPGHKTKAFNTAHLSGFKSIWI